MRVWRIVLSVALVGAAGAQAGLAWAPPTFRVIVHPDLPYSSLERRVVADLFLKKATRWPSGEAARPVDLASESPVRQRFSDEVLGRSVAAVKSYWQQLIFAGRGVPPPELGSDEEVLSFVARHPGSIGYVSGGGGGLSGAKVLSVR
jgi:ABC-type phosphate transport system substrate-binding protein